MVKPSESEKNLQAAVAQAQMVAQQQSTTRLYVGNLSPKLTEDEIHEVFDKLGPVEYVQLTKDPTGGPNWAYVKYRHQDDAKKALSHLNGKELLDMVVKIGLVNEQGGSAPPPS